MGDREKKAGLPTGSTLVTIPAPVLSEPAQDPVVPGPGGLLGDLLGGPHEPWIDIVSAVIVDALPAVLGLLDGQATAVEIAAPAVKVLLQLGATALDDLLAQKSLKDAEKAFDDGVADLLSELKFGPRPLPLSDVTPVA